MKVNSDRSAALDYKVVKHAAGIHRALNNSVRQNMLKLLSENQRMMVTDIYVKMRLEQSVTSQQLGILRRANIVIPEREGKKIFYSLNKKRLAEISLLINEFVDN